MAYTYRGSLTGSFQSQASYNGFSWNPPSVWYGAAKNQGTRQGIDPVETGRWDRKTFRLNPVKIIKEVGFTSYIEFPKWIPNGVTNWGIDYKGQPQSLWFDPVAYSTPAVVWSDSRAEFTRQKVLAKLHSSEFDLGVNLGEIKETLQMLRKPLSAIREFLVNSRRTKHETPLQYLRRISDVSSSTWLEYRYGIIPLISTVSDAMEAIEKGFRDLFLGKRYRRKAKILVPGSGKTDYSTVRFSSFIGTTIRSVVTEEFYVAKVYFEYVRIPTKMEMLGMDLGSLPGIAWELTSLSFVWDWFFGIGNWIEALRADIDRKILGICVSHKVVQTVETKFLPGSIYVTGQPSWRPPDTYSDKASVFKTELLERRLFSSSGITLPAYNPNDLDITRIVDSLSLLWQRMPKQR